MGAINAFAKTIDTITKRPRLLLLPLIMALLVAPINAYVLKDLPMGEFMAFENITPVETQNGVITEEHGAIGNIEDMMGIVKDLIWKSILSSLIGFIFTSIALYGVIKEAILSMEGEEVSFGALVGDSIRNLPGVILVRIAIGFLVGILLTLVLLPGIALIAAGAMMNSGALMGVGVMVSFFVLLPAMGYLLSVSYMALPAYVREGTFGAALNSFGLAKSKVYSSIAFGWLLVMAIVVISIIPGSFGGVFFLGSSGFTAVLLLQLISVPFEALVMTLEGIGGLMFYLELKEEPVEEEFEVMGV